MPGVEGRVAEYAGSAYNRSKHGLLGRRSGRGDRLPCIWGIQWR